MPKQLTDSQAKELLSKSLLEFSRYCDGNGLRYYLCAGTLLGAVRHQGFIPWDDDIDVMMPREDYNRFISLARANPVAPNLHVQDPVNTEGYIWPFAKLVDSNTTLVEKQFKPRFQRAQEKGYGLYIDIFPMDGIPDTREEQERFFQQITASMRDLQRSTYLVRDTEPLQKRLILGPLYKLYEIIGYRVFLEKLDRLATTYPYDRQQFVATCYGSYGIREAMKKEYFAKKREVMFEGNKYSAPIGAHEYLTSLYGDYMQLPPEDKRVTHHKRSLCWAEK